MHQANKVYLAFKKGNGVTPKGKCWGEINGAVFIYLFYFIINHAFCESLKQNPNEYFYIQT